MKNEKYNLLREELTKLNIPSEYYSIGIDREEKLCVIENDGIWSVFYRERGNKSNLYEFDDFNEMKKKLIDILV